MSTRLIGVTSDGISNALTLGYFCASNFSADISGTLTEFRIKAVDACYVKAAIYADNGGDIGTRLWVQNTGQLMAAGWNAIAISPGLVIMSGTTYWLGFNYDTANKIYYLTGTATPVRFRYKSVDYTTIGCPSDASGTSTYGHIFSLQGWGTLPPVGRNNIMIF